MSEPVPNFIGELRPFYGKWNWPMRDMVPGDLFVVDHAIRDPEAVRNYVTMNATRLGKFFSVNARDPERPGYCRVTCTPAPSQREEPQESVLSCEVGITKLGEWYGINFNDTRLWGTLAPQNGWSLIEAKQLKAPPFKRAIVKTDVPDGWFGFVYHPFGFEVHRIEPGTPIEAWPEDDTKLRAWQEDQLNAIL